MAGLGYNSLSDCSVKSSAGFVGGGVGVVYVGRFDFDPQDSWGWPPPDSKKQTGGWMTPYRATVKSFAAGKNTIAYY